MEPAERESVAWTVGRLGVDFLVAFDDRRFPFNFPDSDAEVGDELVEGAELGVGRLVPVEIANETDAQGNVVEVVAGNVSAVDLAGPAVADFDFPIACGIAVADDKVVGEAILHLADIPVVNIKDSSVSLSGSAVVNNNIFPAATFH